MARLVEAELIREGKEVQVLDGDEVRARLTPGLGFNREDRDENVRRIAYVAKLLSQHGVVTITAAISPYRQARDEARREVNQFLEIYVKCPVEVCIVRDVKGLYQKAIVGEIQRFTGVSDPYEEPLDPELVIETNLESAEVSVKKVMTYIHQKCSATKVVD